MSLNDPDEGNELERLTFQAFDSLFPFGTFHSPRVGEGKKSRELCDVLAVSRGREFDNEGDFVIQNKVASAFPEGLKRRVQSAHSVPLRGFCIVFALEEWVSYGDRQGTVSQEITVDGVPDTAELG